MCPALVRARQLSYVTSSLSVIVVIVVVMMTTVMVIFCCLFYDGFSVTTVHRPGDDPRKECEECGNARGSNVRYYPT
jgi:hypothetical protein